MGLIISRFRKKKTTIEILEDIEKDINRLQKNRKENQDRQKKVATSLIIYSIVLYILSAVVFFLLYFPDTWPLRLLYSLPLLAFPFLIWGIKKLLHWYFVKRIAGNDLALRDLREKKKQILEDVMETETYKKAKEILEKFDPARFKKLEKDELTSPAVSTNAPSTSGTVLHQRKPIVSQPSTPMPSRSAAPTPNIRTQQLPQLSSVRSTPNPFGNTPLRPPKPLLSSVTTPAMSAGRGGAGGGANQQQQQMIRAQAMGQQQVMPPQMGRGYGPPGPPMPRSVLPRDRGVMDKMMDYLVGDGPENRYALICRACHSHNGMALKEEFEYMSFRCCYCFVMNPARKQRPLAPRLEFFTPNPKAVTLTKPEESDDDDDDDDSADDGGNKEGGSKTKKEGNSSDSKDNMKTAAELSSLASSTTMFTPVSCRDENISVRAPQNTANNAVVSSSKKPNTAAGSPPTSARRSLGHANPSPTQPSPNAVSETTSNSSLDSESSSSQNGRNSSVNLNTNKNSNSSSDGDENSLLLSNTNTNNTATQSNTAIATGKDVEGRIDTENVISDDQLQGGDCDANSGDQLQGGDCDANSGDQLQGGDCDANIDDQLQGGDCDDEYEMILADGQEKDSVSSLDTKDSEGKGEEQGSGRSC